MKTRPQTPRLNLRPQKSQLQPMLGRTPHPHPQRPPSVQTGHKNQKSGNPTVPRDLWRRDRGDGPQNRSPQASDRKKVRALHRLKTAMCVSGPCPPAPLHQMSAFVACPRHRARKCKPERGRCKRRRAAAERKKPVIGNKNRKTCLFMMKILMQTAI